MSDQQSDFFIPTGKPSALLEQYKHRKLRSIVIGFVVAGLIVSAAMLGGAYWYLTADERLERAATESLRTKVIMYEIPLGFKKVIHLESDNFARCYHLQVLSKQQISPADSKAYPFNAIIEIRSKPRSTISHSTEEAAKKDDRFFRSNGRNFYDKSTSYSRSGSFQYGVRYEMQYDKATGTWKKLSEEYLY